METNAISDFRRRIEKKDVQAVQCRLDRLKPGVLTIFRPKPKVQAPKNVLSIGAAERRGLVCDRQVASLASESLVPASFLVQVG